MIFLWNSDTAVVAKVYFKGVTKTFDSKKILDDFTLEIHDREFMVLVGPSGCGKSTTLRLLAGLEDPTSGEIFIGDQIVNRVDPKDRDIAMVFQNYALYPHYTVAQNLEFSLKLRGIPKDQIKKRVSEIAAMLGLSDLLDRKPKALSGGQRQRVALGRAIIRNPKVFLMDEPLSNLDAKLRVQMRAELIQLQRRLKATTLYVTHDQVEAMTMGERIVVLNEGRIQQIGTPYEIYHEPENKFVAGFIGSPPMNFIERGELTIGVRPEDIVLKSQNPEDVWSLGAVFLMVEPLGAEYLIHFDVERSRWVVRSMEPSTLDVGQKAVLYVPYPKIHLFDERSGGKRLYTEIPHLKPVLKKAA